VSCFTWMHPPGLTGISVLEEDWGKLDGQARKWL
jgi:hypothetical protein